MVKRTSARDSGGGQRSRHGEARYREILAAATENFRRYGFERASLGDIASDSGVSRTAVYHHFANGKEDLFRAVVEGLYDEVQKRVRAAGVGIDDPFEQIEAMLVTKADEFYRELQASPHGVELFAEGDRRCGDIASEFRGAMIEEIAGILRERAASGRLSLQRLGGDPAEAAALLYQASDGLHERHTGRPVSLATYRRRIEQLVDMFRAGTGGR